MLGTTVAEQLRTFRGRLFRLDQHLFRLQRSLDIVGVTPGVSLEELGEIASELAARNYRLLDADDDLGLTMFVTPGPYSTYAPQGGRATVGMHTFPLPFQLWADTYSHGQALVISSIRQVPANCWPVELKCRSRMHYYLADREARQSDPAARALLLDQQQFVTEASTANIVVWQEQVGLVSPPQESILPGVTVAVLQELAAALGIPFHHRPLAGVDVAQADEAFLTSTSPCILPVTRCDGRPIGSGRPGPTFERLMQAWNALVQMDIREQAQKFAALRGTGSQPDVG
jgi:branched-subunit amino acid aminotransferase/4-amino-4-deoxychorismate lyase